MRKYQFDGIRFVLFLMVFATHYHPMPLRVAYLGYALPVFFVMSGFLITNVLLSADDPSLSAKLKTFYARRILRICPAYFVVVLLLISLGAVTYPLSYLLYWINVKLFDLSVAWPLARFHSWFLEAWRPESLHLWSLSVEEQFYILYPLALYSTPVRYRTAMLFAVLCLSIASRFWLMAHYPQSFYGTLLPVCSEYFVWGCLFAWLDVRKRLGALSAAWSFGLSTLAILALVGIEHRLGHSGFLQFTTSHYQTPIALAMGFFIWGLWSLDDRHWVARALSWKPLVYFGAMSYTLYLVHLLALDVFSSTGIELPFSTQTDRIVGAFITTLFMGIAIWHLVEKPVYSLRRYLPYAKSEIPVGRRQGSETGYRQPDSR
ncbi:MAG: acyltransferase [Methylococcaceae bacterium]|nr:acyltransferase [Methylococcaceae bacterium]